MIAAFRQALTLLSPGEKRRVYVILVLGSIAAIMQALAVLSMMPFILLLSSPGQLQVNEFLRWAYEAAGTPPYEEFLVLLGLFGILALVAGNLFVAFEQWVSDRFLNLLAQRIETLVLRRMLRQPFQYFVSHHSAKLSDIVLNQVERVVDGIIGTFITIVGSIALATFVVLVLLLVSFGTTLVTLVGLLAAYLLVFLLLRRRIEAHGAELTGLSAKVFTAVSEAFDGIREIKTRRAEAFFERRFSESRLLLARLAIRYNLMSYLPHFMLETVVLAGFVLVALYFVFTTDDAGVSLALLALYGISVYRLIPALKGIFEGVSAIHHNVDALHLVLRHCREEERAVEQRELPPPARDIRLVDVSHRYDGSGVDQLSGVNLVIPAGSSVCLFGPSGSGKTTVLNVLAGLVSPGKGQVLSDGVEIGEATVDSWRRTIGYCPQQIYLFDDTIANNVAFGIPHGDIDHQRVAQVAALALLEDRGAGRLAPGTIIGEDGDTLSGGQRQRLGIARALYHDPAVLIFDESFTGLDAERQSLVLDNLFGLPGKTLVFSSHDKAIASRCDKVVIFEAGRVAGEASGREMFAAGGA